MIVTVLILHKGFHRQSYTHNKPQSLQTNSNQVDSNIIIQTLSVEILQTEMLET